ncbi:UNVERIFIED_CONTAM: hypothetical protein K2H54_015003 [Gekko kuhli]
MTVDYRALKAVTPPVAPVVAKYNEILATIAAGSRYYSVIDLANAFHLICLHESCWYKFAFTFREIVQDVTREVLNLLRETCFKASHEKAQLV